MPCLIVPVVRPKLLYWQWGWCVSSFGYLCTRTVILSRRKCPVVEPLGPPANNVYINAHSDEICECSTVTYSLFSACAACQGHGWVKYGLPAAIATPRGLC